MESQEQRSPAPEDGEAVAEAAMAAHLFLTEGDEEAEQHTQRSCPSAEDGEDEDEEEEDGLRMNARLMQTEVTQIPNRFNGYRTRQNNSNDI